MYPGVNCGIILLNLNNFKKQKNYFIYIMCSNYVFYPRLNLIGKKKFVIFFWPYQICTVFVVVVAAAVLYFWNSLPENRSVLGVEGP